ncbi:MAG TPA: Ig-like domain-containing protein [Xanthobacteraceae bacterium]
MPTYAFTILNDPLGADGTFPQGINNDGQIVGYYIDGSGVSHGYLYGGGSFLTIDAPSSTGPGGTNLNGINRQNQIAGWYSDGTSYHSFVYDDGSFAIINDPSAGNNSSGTNRYEGTYAKSINDKGQIVGYYIDSAGIWHGFLDDNGVFTDIDAAPGATNVATGIDNNGQIIGYYLDGSGYHGFLDDNGVFTNIDAGGFTIPAGINNDGDITGYGGSYGGFLYSNGSFTAVNDPLGYSFDQGINDFDQIVGYANNQGFLASRTPAVAVSIDITALNLANPTGLVTFVFSEAPVAFTLADTSAVGGSLSNLQQVNSTTYTATFTAAADTDITNGSVSVSTTSSVKFSSAVATFYEVQNNWAPSQMIDGIFTGPPPGPGQDSTYGGVNGWSVFNLATGVAEGADALLTLATPLPAGQYNLTFGIYQNYYGNPGHLLGDFALDYTTDATTTLSSPQTPVSIQSASSLNGTTFSFLSPGELLANTSQNSVGIDTYTISASVDSASPITGIFLDAIKNPALPGGGPGAFDNGNFDVSEFTLDASISGSTAPFTVDTVKPTVSVSIDNTDINLADPTGLVTFTFNKAPTDFSLDDVSSLDGSLSNLNGSGTNYTATFKAYAGVDDNAATVSVINGSYHDADGNAGDGASATFALHTTGLGTLWDELSSLLTSAWTILSDIFATITGQHAGTTDLLNSFQQWSSASKQTFTNIQDTHQDSSALLRNYLASTFVTPSDGHDGPGFLSSLVTTVSHETPFLSHPSG